MHESVAIAWKMRKSFGVWRSLDGAEDGRLARRQLRIVRRKLKIKSIAATIYTQKLQPETRLPARDTRRSWIRESCVGNACCIKLHRRHRLELPPACDNMLWQRWTTTETAPTNMRACGASRSWRRSRAGLAAQLDGGKLLEGLRRLTLHDATAEELTSVLGP